MMRTYARWLILHLLILVAFTLKAQYFDAGHEPASTRWRVIKAGQFDLIFPDTLEAKAQQLAVYVDSVLSGMQRSYSRPLRRIPIVLHNQKSVSNAFVGWAPSRMEFYTIPPPDNYAHDWLEQLAIHESTHWFQFSQMYQGLTGILARMFGEHVAAGVFGLYVPFWAIEGDAVYQETALTRSGRGRDADFEQLLRTRLVTHMPFSYDKAYLGSYRDITANHYELGYQLVTYGKEKYGDHLWDSVYRYVARNPYNPVAFTMALKKYTGLYKEQFYRETMEFLDKEWETLNSFRKPVDNIITIAEAEEWNRYRYPVVLPDNSIIAEKLSLDDIRVLIHIDQGGNERKLCYPGITMDAGYNLAGDKIFYSALSRHPRWPNIEFSDIWYCDVNRGAAKRITTGNRYFSPAADTASGNIYAIRYDEQHRHTLVIMNIGGQLISEFPLPAGLAASQLSWWNYARRVLFIGTNSNGKAIYSWDGVSDPERVSPYTWVNIDHPRGFQDGILFQAAFDGVNDIFLYLPADKTNYRITRSQFGAMHPFPDGAGNIYYSEVRPTGNAICKVPRDKLLNERVELSNRSVGFVLADRLPQPERHFKPLDNLCDSCFTSTRYRSILHLFRFHSWAPANIDADQKSVQPGLSILSQNTLSTAFFSAGFKYDISTLDREYFADFSYKGFMPQINMSYSFAEPVYKSSDTTISDFRYERHSAGFSLSLPLITTARQWTNYFNAELGINRLAFAHKPETHPDFISGGLSYGYYRLYAHRIRRSSARNLYPKWGQVFDYTRISTLTGSIDAGSVNGLRAISYIPGFFRNHGIRIYLGVQKRGNGEDLSFNRLIATPRGFPAMPVDDATAIQINYRMPICYPDISIGPLVYIKRLSITGFYDAISGNHPDMEPGRYSYGFELSSDIHLLRHFAPVSMGYGLALPSVGKAYHYFLFNIDFTI